MLDNGDFWTIYGTQPSTVFYINGFVQGNGVSNNGSFSSSNAKDFGFSPAASATVSASYNATAQTINGTGTEAAGTISFAGGAVPTSIYNYAQPANLTSITGSWNLTDQTGSPIALTVASNGNYTATNAGCTFTGTFTPRGSGKNVFNVTIQFGPSPCTLANQTGFGIAIDFLLASGQTELLITAVDSTRTYGAVAFGAR